MYSEEQLLPISALQHLQFCRRQCALIHIESLWAENHLTVEGEHLHDKAHEGGVETADGVRVARSLYVHSCELGLRGQADIVEFPPDAPPVPVEYKRGRPKKDNCDQIQLCAQAVCLEQILQCEIPMGCIFYGQTRHRLQVSIDTALRSQLKQAAQDLHQLIESGITPPAKLGRQCRSCSLINLCMPYSGQSQRSVKRYLGRNLFSQSVAVPQQDQDI